MESNIHPPKRIRARVTKVRTGCKTCKIRHLKCDEAKPTCNRCRKDLVICDGYVVLQAIPAVQRKSKQKSMQISILTNPSAGADAPCLDTRYLHHAIQHTVRDLGDSMLNTRFWNERLPQLGLHVEGIKHALIALGAAHEAFFLRSRTAAQNYNQRFVLLHYNLAIRHIQPLMSDPNLENIQATLVCCLLFVCLENVSGNYMEAIRHIRSGARLLATLSNNKVLGTTRKKTRRHLPGANNGETLPNMSSSINDDISHLSTLFSCVSIDTSTFLESELIPLSKLPGTLSITRPLDTQNLSTASTFSSIAEARGELYRLELAHSIILGKIFVGTKEEPDNIDPLRGYSQHLPPQFSEGDKQAYRQLFKQFWSWSARFDTMVHSFLERTISVQEKHNFLKVRLLQKLWAATLDKEPWVTNMEGDFEFEDLVDIVEAAEAIVEANGPQSHPLFTFDGDIIPSLALVGCFTDDMGLMMRVIEVLNKLDRREGIWDSRDLAEVFEAALFSHNAGRPIKGDHGGVLFMANMLSSMKIPCISATNSIVAMSQMSEL